MGICSLWSACSARNDQHTCADCIFLCTKKYTCDKQNRVPYGDVLGSMNPFCSSSLTCCSVSRRSAGLHLQYNVFFRTFICRRYLYTKTLALLPNQALHLHCRYSALGILGMRWRNSRELSNSFVCTHCAFIHLWQSLSLLGVAKVNRAGGQVSC